MKTAITIIAICEVIRTIQVTVDLAISAMVRKKTLESINKVGDSVADELTPDNIVKAIVNEKEDQQGMTVEFGCKFAICVTSGKGYEEGVVYPILGDNNGIHILREDKWGDPYDLLTVTGGIGEGTFNNGDDSGRPSFDQCSFDPDKVARAIIEEANNES